MTEDRLRAALEDLPRRTLAVLPTPLRRAVNLSDALGVDLWVKRDDLTGFAFGGNKVRSAEYLVGDAAAHRATSLITTAAAQSNFCRVMSAAGRLAGMQVRLLLRGTGREPIQGNLLLDRVFGAEIRFTDDPDPYSVETRGRLETWAAEERAAGRRPYIVHMHDGSAPGALATAGHAHAALELGAQCRAAAIRPQHLYLAAGSGSTLAGLLLGARWAGSPLAATRMVGVCVGALPDVVRPKVRQFLRTAADLLGLPAVDEEPDLDGGERGDGYGVPTASGLDAIGMVSKAEGMLLNPVYTAKAFAALRSDIARGSVGRDETVVFVNTGGDPLVFAYAEALAAPPGAAHS